MAEATQVQSEPIVENPEVLAQKRFEFRIVSGSHIEPEVDRDEQGNPVMVPVLGPNNRPEFRDGRPVLRIRTKDVIYGPRRPAGDVFRSNSDLRQHNGVNFRTDTGEIKRRRGVNPDQFELLDGSSRPEAEMLSVEKRRSQFLEAETRKILERMDRKQLAEYAESEGIDLRGATKHADILKIVLERHQDLMLA